MKTSQSGRLLSLDVMRGITISGMILVNNPGSWTYMYAPLRHAAWNGLTPTDLVFPFFMFIMGVSMFFSLKPFNFQWSKQSVEKVLKRTALIFLVGLGLNAFGQSCYEGAIHFETLRILGVMQRLAIAYGIGSLICLVVNHKYLLHIATIILLFYAALLGLTDSLSQTTDNIVAIVDRALLGENHMYLDYMSDGSRIIFDPEGLLSSIGSISHVLFGFYAGKIITENKKDTGKVIQNLSLFGTILLFAGLLLQYGCPINKRLWSSTFVLTTCGFGSLLLSLLIWLIDVRGKRKGTTFFESFGVNPLYQYVQADVLAILAHLTGLTHYVYQDIFMPLFGQYGGSLAWSLFFVGINWIPGYLLYKKKIYIKL